MISDPDPCPAPKAAAFDEVSVQVESKEEGKAGFTEGPQGWRRCLGHERPGPRVLPSRLPVPLGKGSPRGGPFPPSLSRGEPRWGLGRVGGFVCLAIGARGRDERRRGATRGPPAGGGWGGGLGPRPDPPLPPARAGRRLPRGQKARAPQGAQWRGGASGPRRGRGRVGGAPGQAPDRPARRERGPERPGRGSAGAERGHVPRPAGASPRPAAFPEEPALRSRRRPGRRVYLPPAARGAAPALPIGRPGWRLRGGVEGRGPGWARSGPASEAARLRAARRTRRAGARARED